jgi:hypothetical protein
MDIEESNITSPVLRPLTEFEQEIEDANTTLASLEASARLSDCSVKEAQASNMTQVEITKLIKDAMESWKLAKDPISKISLGSSFSDH